MTFMEHITVMSCRLSHMYIISTRVYCSDSEHRIYDFASNNKINYCGDVGIINLLCQVLCASSHLLAIATYIGCMYLATTKDHACINSMIYKLVKLQGTDYCITILLQSGTVSTWVELSLPQLMPWNYKQITTLKAVSNVEDNSYKWGRTPNVNWKVKYVISGCFIIIWQLQKFKVGHCQVTSKGEQRCTIHGYKSARWLKEGGEESMQLS